MTASSMPAGNQPQYVYKRIRPMDSDSDDTAASPAKKPTAVAELTTSVKERRFRNMSEMFPDISPMVRTFLFFYCGLREWYS